jgi:hypothetical protein
VDNELTHQDELALTLIAMADEGNHHPETEAIASRFGWTVDDVDLAARLLEQRGLVQRVVTMIKPGRASWISVRDTAFLWKEKSGADWPARRRAAEDWLRAQPVPSVAASDELVEASGMHRRAVAALMHEWGEAGALKNVRADITGRVTAITTGLPSL